jgi:hypothetical protein
VLLAKLPVEKARDPATSSERRQDDSETDCWLAVFCYENLIEDSRLPTSPNHAAHSAVINGDIDAIFC